MMGEMIVLRIVHVLGGIFWVGSALFNSIYLIPALGAAGPAAGAVMGSMRQRHLFTVLPTVAFLTVLSGTRLLAITSGGFSAAYFETGRGMTFGTAGALAILAFLLGIFVARPTGMKLGAIQQSLANATDDDERARLRVEMSRLQRRNVVLGRFLNTLLIVSALGMAVARYIP